jgi:hypothetical protein
MLGRAIALHRALRMTFALLISLGILGALPPSAQTHGAPGAVLLRLVRDL